MACFERDVGEEKDVERWGEIGEGGYDRHSNILKNVGMATGGREDRGVGKLGIPKVGMRWVRAENPGGRWGRKNGGGILARVAILDILIFSRMLEWQRQGWEDRGVGKLEIRKVGMRWVREGKPAGRWGRKNGGGILARVAILDIPIFSRMLEWQRQGWEDRDVGKFGNRKVGMRWARAENPEGWLGGGTVVGVGRG
jgi:hypothetical protein